MITTYMLEVSGGCKIRKMSMVNGIRNSFSLILMFDMVTTEMPRSKKKYLNKSVAVFIDIVPPEKNGELCLNELRG